MLADDLKKFCYKCAPETCGARVCCARFDIAVSAEERARIEELRPRLAVYCPWLTDEKELFNITPCFLFIKKRENGLCLFNFPANGRDDAAGYYCALHALALAEGKNPYQVKPRGCALWPFLEDGAGELQVDAATTDLPCLRPAPGGGEPDAELTALLAEIKK